MAPDPVARLDGWKAVADYLGRDVRTAQRWRDERGMPMHRVPGHKGGTVFAERAELDAWLFQYQATSAATPTRPENAERRPRPRAPLADDRHPPTPPAGRPRSGVAMAVSLLAIGIIAVGAARIIIAMRRPSSAST